MVCLFCSQRFSEILLGSRKSWSRHNGEGSTWVCVTERKWGRGGEEGSNTSVQVAARQSALSWVLPRRCAGPAVWRVWKESGHVCLYIPPPTGRSRLFWSPSPYRPPEGGGESIKVWEKCMQQKAKRSELKGSHFYLTRGRATTGKQISLWWKCSTLVLLSGGSVTVDLHRRGVAAPV